MATMQDMVTPEKKTIRNISLDRPKQPAFESVSQSEQNTTEPTRFVPRQPNTNTPLPNYTLPLKKKKWFSTWMIISAVAVLVIVGVILASTVFAKAIITVTPRTQQVSIDTDFEVQKESSVNSVRFDYITLELESSKTLKATGEERVEKTASGRIVVYNNYQTASQRLIKNTRFETPEGLIYRIPESIVVPGQHTDANGKKIPGSIEVVVYADSPGAEYNIGLSDFTVPGFKGQPQFDGFYARSKTPMSGGFSGIMKTPSEADKQKGYETLKNELEKSLSEKVQESMPEGFVFLDNDAHINFEELPSRDGNNDDEVAIVLKGTLEGIIVDTFALAHIIAEKTIADYDGGSVHLYDTARIRITTDDQATNANGDQRVFHMTGDPQIVWDYESENLIKDLAGKSKKQIPIVLEGYPGINTAEVVIRPIWKRSVPEKLTHIEIIDTLLVQ